MGVIASGALLIAVNPGNSTIVSDKLAKNGIKCSVIGKLTNKDNGLKLISDGEVRDLPIFEVDEITKVY